MVKISKLFKYILILVLLIENCFFYLVNIPQTLAQYMSFYVKGVIGAISLVLFIIVLIVPKFHREITKNYKFAVIYAFIYITAIICVFIASIVFKNVSIKNAVLVALPYCVVLLYYPILLSMRKDDSIEQILSILNIFALIWYVLTIGQSLLFEKIGVVFLKNISSTVSLRNSRMRIDLAPFGNIMLIYNFYKALDAQKGKYFFNFINLLLGVIAILYVEQTRAMIMILVVCIGFLLLSEKKAISRTWRNIILFLLIATFAFTSGYVNKFVSTFSDISYSGSNIARRYAINYYLSVFKSNPFCGFGFTCNSTLIHGMKGIAYIDDVGIFGQMARLGIFAFVIILPILAHWWRIALRTKKQMNNNLLMAFFLYMVGSLFTLIILDNQRIMLFPFMIAVFEFSFRKAEERNREKEHE